MGADVRCAGATRGPLATSLRNAPLDLATLVVGQRARDRTGHRLAACTAYCAALSNVSATATHRNDT